MTNQEKAKAVEKMLEEARGFRKSGPNNWVYEELNTMACKLHSALENCKVDGVENWASYHLDEFLK